MKHKHLQYGPFKTTSDKHMGVIEARGFVIHYAIRIENLIDEILAYHFCGDNKEKTRDFIHLILGNIGYLIQAKSATMFNIMKIYHNEFIANNVTLSKDIETLISTRNKVAHHAFDANSDDYDSLVLRFKTVETVKATKKGKSNPAKFVEKEEVLNLDFFEEYTKLYLRIDSALVLYQSLQRDGSIPLR